MTFSKSNSAISWVVKSIFDNLLFRSWYKFSELRHYSLVIFAVGIGRSKVIDKSEWYVEPCQTSKMEHFARVNGWKLLTIFAKSSILDVWQDSEYACPWGLFFIIMMYAVLYAFWSEKLWKLLAFFLNQNYNNKKTT